MKPSSYNSRLRSSIKLKDSAVTSTDLVRSSSLWVKDYWLAIDYLDVVKSAIVIISLRRKKRKERRHMDHRAKKKLRSEDEKDDRISKLSDDLIHQIMLFLDTRFAVQTSTLSKRWKLVWKTLPFLSFHGYDQHYKCELNKFIYSKFINHVFSRRNHQCRIHKLDLCPSNGLHINCLIKYVKYAISHDVESLNVELNHYCVLSMFNSNSLKELKLAMPFDYDDVMESACWSLPNLTNLYLNRFHNFKLKDRADYKFEGKFPQSCLICLSALTSLSLDNCTLPEIFSLPSLTTLKLKGCALPKNVWDLPALLTLELDHMILHMNLGVYLLALANLRNLAIYSKGWDIKNCVISCVQLVNLKISALVYTAVDSEWSIVVSAPKLCNFTAVGSFPITFDGCELENVEIKSFKSDFFREGKPQAQCKMMFSQLGSAKNVTLDLETLKELYKISDKLVHLESPFYNLKHLKLPRGCKKSSISSIVRRYLLGASPKITGCTLIQKWSNTQNPLGAAQKQSGKSDSEFYIKKSYFV